MSKILKFIWFISLLAGLVALLWSYASVSFTVMITEANIIERESFFYLGLAFLAISNFSLYGIGKFTIIEKYLYLLSWKYTFGIIANGFFIVSMLFIGLYNNTEPYDFNNFGYLILVFLALMVVWLIVLPFLIIFGRKLDRIMN